MSMQNRIGEKGSSTVVIVGALAVGMLVAIYLGQTIGYGEWKKAYLLLLGLGAVSLFLALGRNYWVVVPFAMTVSLPAIPLGPGRAVSLGELAAVAALAALALRLPFAEAKVRWVRVEYVPILLFVFWAAFIYRVNGAGLAIFGSSTVGARSYLQIALAGGVFFVICNQRVEERHCKLIVCSLLVAAVLSTGWNIYQFFFLQAGEELYTGGFYSWHQNLSLLPMFFLAFVFAKFSPVDLLRDTRVKWILAIAVCYALAAYSGKRAVFAACLLMPMLSFVFRRQYLPLGLSVVAATSLLFLLVAGHGRVFELPMTVQRVLWAFPGKWDPEVRMSTANSFRQTLNMLAMRQIESHPVVGQGFGFAPVDARLASNEQALQRIRERGDHVAAYVMAVGGQWHSTWLGIAATLGIPGAVLWGLVWLQVLVVAWYVVRRAPPDSWGYILAVILLMLTVVDICRSMTSGHAAQNLWAVSWRLGVLIVLRWQIREGEAAAFAGSRVVRRVPAAARPHPRFRPVPMGQGGEALAKKK